MDPRLLDILCCPVSKTPVRFLAEDELAALNHAIGTDRVVNAAGTQIAAAVPTGLITRDGRTIYRIEEDIPVMLADEAIAASQITDFPRR